MVTRQQGFTLLEVLVAFVLFALSFAVVMQILTGSIRNTSRSQDYTQATLWADSVMAEVGLDAPLEAGASSGSFNDKYRYDLSISEYEMALGESGPVSETLPVQLFRVEVLVYWGAGNNPATASFVTLKAINANRK